MPESPPGGGGRTAGRLELTTEVLAATSAVSCARAAVEWLVAEGVEAVACLLVDADREVLAVAAHAGRLDEPAGDWELPLKDERHPLVLALAGRQPMVFDGAVLRSVPQTPLGSRTHTALPLGDQARQPEAVGLLLAADLDEDSEPFAAACFAASLLGTRLCALSYGLAVAKERRHRRELAWYTQVIESVTDPTLLTDAQGRMLLANDAAENLLSARDDMSEGRRRAVALNNMLFSASLSAGTENRPPSRRELLLVDPIDGRDLLFELLATSLDPDRPEAGTVSVLRNVTDLHRAAEELQENYFRLRAAEAKTRAERDRLDLILNAVLDPILVTDPSGDIVLTNPPAERLFTVRDGASEPGVRRVRGNDAVVTSFVSKLHAGQSRRLRGELALTDPESGEAVPVEAVSTRVISAHGEDTAVVTILHDLAEAKEKAVLYEQVKRHSELLEERVREATTELAGHNELLRRQALALEQASALKSQFLANVSHELRTPLNAIIGYASLLQEGVVGEVSRKQFVKLERLQSNAQHLLAIINDLLDISRIEAGKMPLHVERFSLLELVAEVMAEVDPLIPATGLAVTHDVPPDAPSLASDRQKVKQILINLLSNALKFTPAGSVSVCAEHDAEHDRFVVAVADTGVGISAENQKTIFEAFGQSDSSYSRSQRGTGLGLSICRRLASLLRGEILLESEPGEGSTFTLLLPRNLES